MVGYEILWLVMKENNLSAIIGFESSNVNLSKKNRPT